VRCTVHAASLSHTDLASMDYSPEESVEEQFCELRLIGFLGS
jgi:hypothetical protein